MRILIIEDDPIISETLDICFSLRWPEAVVVVTDTGEEGLKLATAQPPDVIILEARPKSRKSPKIVTPPDTNFWPKLPRKGVFGRISRGH